MKWAAALLLFLCTLLLIRQAGRLILRRPPSGGIHEQMYVPINGTKQWFSIYGKNRDNPVLLYLHGGPGASTSSYDYAFTRKWADVYTVVTWDQRCCGKSWRKDHCDPELTYDMWMRDGLEITKFLLEYLGKEKITLLGHSWGTVFGCNLVLSYPELFDCYIGTGQLVDYLQNEEAFILEAAKWTEQDPEGQKLLQKLKPGDFSAECRSARHKLMKRYGFDMWADGSDYSLTAAQLFNPYYNLKDYRNLLRVDFSAYEKFLNSEEFAKFSLLGKEIYPIPYYNINGDRDYQTNFRQAQEYFDQISAPRKKMYLMKDTTHGLLESKSREFSKILHEIAREEHLYQVFKEESP